MAFFNKKEEVLHVELTPLGRHLLSLGKLKPYSYKFFDDDVLYNPSAGGVSEAQNETHRRIIKDTPKLKHNGNINGIMTNSNSILVNDPTGGFFVGPTHKQLRKYYNKESHEKYTEHIGTSKNDTKNAPNLKIDLFNGTIQSAAKFLENEEQVNTRHIPQINIDVEYKVLLTTYDEAPSSPDPFNYKTEYVSEQFDQNIIVVTPEIPLIRISSDGEIDNKHVYDIECYKVSSGSSGETYNQLKFIPQTEKIINGMLIDDETNMSMQMLETDVDSSYSEYYFTIETDRDIPDEDYCSTLGSLEVKNIYLDENIRCPDQSQKNISYNPYFSKVTEKDIEECD